MTSDEQAMGLWNRAPFLPRLVASCIHISETSGTIIKNVMAGGDLKIVNKGAAGKPEELQTEADRRVQFCIFQSLHKKFSGLKIIGEEDVTSACPELVTTFETKPLELDIPESIKGIKEDEVVVWVDPLDGTSEIAYAVRNKDEALLEQVTVLIGVAYKGIPVAGVIHQPYHGTNGRTIWAIQGCGVHGIEIPKAKSDRVVVTTRSHLTESVTEALEALKQKGLCDDVRKVGGAGYKVIRLFEDSAAYVFASAGCKKWDTCAPEAVIAASGGCLTDISGRQIRYEPDVQLNTTGGVLATASWVSHKDYVESIPQTLKESLPEFKAKQ